jgi:D-alanyl-lipoteichoic acid acyltransferase DltB (MBOAT superfamily)
VLFPTPQFALFFLVVLSLFWAVRRKRTLQKWLLLCASFFFYGFFDWRFVALLAVSSALNFGAGEAIARSQEKLRRKTWLAAGVAGNVLILGLFKYYNFFQENVAGIVSLLGLEAHLPILEVAVPVGISFYTFQGLAYVIDLHAGCGFRARCALDFFVFMSFFPKLLMGPILRSKDVLPELAREAPETIPDLSMAVTLIVSGLFKKTLLATFLGTHLVSDAFISPENHMSVELLTAMYAYTAMIYCDFSGYTDMARGLGLMLGFRLPENFNAPLASTSIGDFWRRWHMTFSGWLRDYVYFPLGGSKVPRPRTYLNLTLTFLVAGLWHGANWKFVVWGAIHGIALVAYKASLDIRRDMGIDPERRHPFWYLALGWFVTLNLCAVARIFFRSPDIETAGAFFSGLFEFSSGGRGVELAVVLMTVFAIGLNFFGRHLRDGFSRLHEQIPVLLRAPAWAAIAFAVVTIRPSGVAPYIYFQF